MIRKKLSLNLICHQLLLDRDEEYGRLESCNRDALLKRWKESEKLFQRIWEVTARLYQLASRKG